MLKELREATKEAHERAENLSLASKIMDATISVAEYENLLRQQLQAYQTVEQHLNAHRAIFPAAFHSFVNYNKSKDLKKDLNPSHDDNSYPKTLTPHNSFPELLGMLYVIEGSMMGSMLIQKKLPKCENLQEITKHHFFSLNVQEQLAKWKTFCSLVEAQDFSKNELKNCIQGANITFQLFTTAYTERVVG